MESTQLELIKVDASAPADTIPAVIPRVSLNGTSTAPALLASNPVLQSQATSVDPQAVLSLEVKPEDSNDDAFVDSGYGTGTGSPSKIQEQAEAEGDAASTLKSIPVLVHQSRGLNKYGQTVEQQVIGTFEDAVKRLEKPLFKALPKVNGKSPPVVIRMMVLGRTEEDAKPWMVVFCPQNQSELVRGFFRKKFCKRILRPKGPDAHCFETLVIGQPPNTAAADASLDVFGGLNLEYPPLTSCGTRIKLSHNGLERQATLGGIIKAQSLDGNYKLYGLTAGHFLDINQYSILDHQSDSIREEYQDPISDDRVSSDESEDEECSSNIDINVNQAADSTVPLAQNPNPIDPWPRFGTISLGLADAQNRHGDWALIEDIQSKFCLPNHLVESNELRYRYKDLRALPNKSTALTSATKIVVNSVGPSAMRWGTLSNLPAMFLLPGARKFVRVFPVSMEHGSAIVQGDSGAWVVDPSSAEVFGHIVGVDPLGDAYVVPLSDTFEEIRHELGASIVCLATSVDILCNPAGGIEKKQPAVPLYHYRGPVYVDEGSLNTVTVIPAQTSVRSASRYLDPWKSTTSPGPARRSVYRQLMEEERKPASIDSGYASSEISAHPSVNASGYSNTEPCNLGLPRESLPGHNYQRSSPIVHQHYVGQSATTHGNLARPNSDPIYQVGSQFGDGCLADPRTLPLIKPLRPSSSIAKSMTISVPNDLLKS